MPNFWICYYIEAATEATEATAEAAAALAHGAAETDLVEEHRGSLPTVELGAAPDS